MTDDIAKHLQDAAWCKHYNDGGNNPSGKLMEEAAAEITRLRAENEKLREALKPFAADAGDFDFMEDHDEVGVPVGDLRAAAAAIRESGDE